MEMKETSPHMEKLVEDSIEQMQNSEICIKAKRSKAKVRNRRENLTAVNFVI